MTITLLPPLVDGCNTTLFLESRRNFLHGCSRDFALKLPKLSSHELQASSAMLEDQELHLRCCHALEHGIINQTTVDELKLFLIKCLEGEMDNYFKARKEYYFNRSDALGQGLLTLIQQRPEPITALTLQDCVNEIAFFQDTILRYLQLLPTLQSDKRKQYAANVIRTFENNSEKLLADIEFLLQEDPSPERISIVSQCKAKREGFIKEVSVLDCKQEYFAGISVDKIV